MVIAISNIYDFEPIFDTKTGVKWVKGFQGYVGGRGLIHAPMGRVREALEEMVGKYFSEIIDSKRYLFWGKLTGFRVIPSELVESRRYFRRSRTGVPVTKMAEFLKSRFEGDYTELCESKRPSPPTLLPGAKWPKKEVVVRIIHEFKE